MKPKFVIHWIFLSLCIGCDSLSDEYFINLFMIDNVEIERICKNNPSVFSDGNFVEIYHISDEMYLSIDEEFKGKEKLDLPIKNGYDAISKYDSIITWHKTLVDEEVTDFIVKNINLVNDSLKCFTIGDLKNLLHRENNYFTFFYNTSESNVTAFNLCVLDSGRHNLYFLKILML
jgi:hypothetical protein